MQKYCDPNLVFDYNDDKKEVYAKDIANHWPLSNRWFLSHTMKDLTDQSLQKWSNDWKSLISNPTKFHAYAQQLHIQSLDFQSCTTHEKMLILWRFIKKNTYSTHRRMSQTKGFLSAFVGQDINHYKKEKNLDPKLKNYSSCMGLALVYRTLAKEFFWIDGEIKSVHYHSYFKASTGECIDYSEASMKDRKNWLFATEEEYLERTAIWQPNKKAIIGTTQKSIHSLFSKS